MVSHPSSQLKSRKWNMTNGLFFSWKIFDSFIYFNWRIITLQHCDGFATHQYEWAIGTHHSLLDTCKSKSQWGIISHWTEWPTSKSLHTINAGQCGEKGTLPHCWWECKLIQPLRRTVWRFLKKLWPRNPTLGHIPLGNQNWKRHMYPNDHCSIIYNSWGMEAV